MNNNNNTKSDDSSVSSTTTENDSGEENDEIDENQTNRAKRSINWCVNERLPKISWPPESSSSSSNWRQLKPVRLGNPLYGTKMQLFSKTNHHLAIYPDGTVRGTPDEDDLHTYLELLSAGYAGHVRIKGLLTNLYVAMDHKGRLYGEPDIQEESTVFIESFQGSYSTYLSRKYAHLGWYIGLKKSGKFKRGPKTAYGQKAIRFLPRRSKFQ